MSFISINSNVIASRTQTFLDTKSLMQFASTSRATRQAYLPHLDRRLIALFGLRVSSKPTHDEVMNALCTLPPGETKRVVSEFNELLKQNAHLFRTSLLLNTKDTFCLSSEIVPFETRDKLIRIVGNLWMEHYEKFSPFFNRQSCNLNESITDPSTWRFLHVVSKYLADRHPLSFEPKMIEFNVAAADPLVLESLVSNWKTFSLTEQARALFTIGLSLARITDLSHPAVPIVKSLLAADGWADERLRKPCAQLVEKRIASLTANLELEEEPDQSLFIRTISIGLLCTPTASKNKAYVEFIFDLMEATDVDIFQQSSKMKTVDVLLQGNGPLYKDELQNLLDNTPLETITTAISIFRDNWRNLSVQEQADTLIVIGKFLFDKFMRQELDPQIADLIKAFAENDCIGWKDESMQKAAAYLVQQAREPNPYTLKNRLLMNMIEALANPTYRNDHDTIFRLLSNSVKDAESEEEIKDVENQWEKFTQEVSHRKISELSLEILPPENDYN